MKRALILLSMILSIACITCLSSDSTASSVNIVNESVFPNDFFAVGQNISNTSTVQGDMISIGDTISNTGIVNGDFLGGGTNIYLNGSLLDDVRVFGQNIRLDAQVGKNVNILGGKIDLSSETSIKGDLLVAGRDLKVNGTVNGTTYVMCGKTELSGTFNGDVYIKVMGYNPKNNTPIIIGPNTKIKGSLIYTSPVEASIANSAQVESIRKNIVKSTNTSQNISSISGYAFVRSFVSAILYSLIGFLVLRLFPHFINKSRETFKTKTFSSFGIGLLGAFSIILSFIVSIVLFIAIIFISPVFALTYITVSTGFYVALFYLSTIPPALFIGDMFINAENKIFLKLTLGVLTISFATLFLDYLRQATAYGNIFDIVNVLLIVFISLTGFGSLLKAIKKTYKSEETQAT